jgi:hypothetical protein
MSVTRLAPVVVAAIIVAALAGCADGAASPGASPAPASGDQAVTASSTAAPAPSPTASAGPSSSTTATIADFVDRFGPVDGDTTWLSAAEVEEEFHAAAAAFPLALPDGYTWPSGLGRSHGTAAQWERGTGVVQAYFFWEGAHATAAYADARRGDRGAALEHLEALVEGYVSPVRSLYVDPEQPGADSGYYRGVLEPALLRADYSALARAQVEPFLSDDERREIAAAAGDAVDFGTEGLDAGPAGP